jgi:hypothetical protein
MIRSDITQRLVVGFYIGFFVFDSFLFAQNVVVSNNVFINTKNIEVAALSDGKDINDLIYSSWSLTFHNNNYCGRSTADPAFYWQLPTKNANKYNFSMWQTFGSFEHDKTS